MTAILLGSPLVGGVALAAPTAVRATTTGAATSRAATTATVTGRAATARVEVPGRATLPSDARAAGAVPATRTITGSVALVPRDPAALTAFATEVSTPGSASYGQYLARGAFAARFGPSASTVHAVEAQLRASGLTVTSVSDDDLLVGFRGSALKAGAAFGTRLEQYRLAGEPGAFATTSALTFPAAVAGSIQTVIGLDDLTQLHSTIAGGGRVEHGGATGHARAEAPAAAPTTGGGPVACKAATTDAAEYGGLTDAAIARSYGVDGLYSQGDTGAGQTIDLFELEPYMRSDIDAFDTCYFGATRAAAMMSRLSTVAVDGGEQVGYGEGEAELDIDDVSAVAPGAAIHVYEAPNTDLGALDNYAAMVDADDAKVISTSWGDCEPVQKAAYPGSQELENVLFEQAAAQGQSVFAAAGDAGTADCSLGDTAVEPHLAVDDPASQPFVTAVGGLTITDATQPPAEHVWNDGASGGGGGGGVSSTWSQPAWQADSKVPGMDDTTVIAAAAREDGSAFCQANPVYEADETGCREVPDVSAQADEFTGAVTVYFEGQWSTIGGTSSSTPLWAAMIALVDASATCSTTGGVGFANPSLYAVASVPAEYKASFTDVTSGNNDVFGVTGGLYPATVGYDMASGLGSPELTAPGGGHGLAYYLCTAAATSRPTVTSLAPAVVDSASGGTFAIDGTGFEAGGAPDVAGVQIGTVGVPATDYTVASATKIDVTVPSAAALSGTSGATFFDDGNGSYQVTVTLTGGLTSAPGAAARLAVDAPGGTPEVDSVGPSGVPDAGGTPVTVYGSGFAGATEVAFGGVAVAVTAADVNAAGTQIDVRTPARQSDTTCAHAVTATVTTCQVAVTVTTPAGTSPAGTILPEYAGTYDLDQDGFLAAPAGCGCEVAPSPTELDYLPAPTITSYSAGPRAADGDHYASERGGTVLTLHGTGLGLLGLEWVDAGPSRDYTSEDYDFTYVSDDTLQVALPAVPTTSAVTHLPVSVQTLASPDQGDLASATPPSTVVEVPFAPVPAVTSVAGPTTLLAGPVTGGTTLTVHGHGFTAATRVDLSDEGPQPFSTTTQHTVHVVDDDELTVVTPADNPGTDDLQVCDATVCSVDHPAVDTFVYFPPGNPRLDASTPASGRAGTTVTLTGANLGDTEAVFFGARRATIVPEPSLLDSGSTTTVVVRAPAGTTGRVDIRVATVESIVTGYGRSPATAAATFTTTG